MISKIIWNNRSEAVRSVVLDPGWGTGGGLGWCWWAVCVARCDGVDSDLNDGSGKPGKSDGDPNWYSKGVTVVRKEKTQGGGGREKLVNDRRDDGATRMG